VDTQPQSNLSIPCYKKPYLMMVNTAYPTFCTISLSWGSNMHKKSIILMGNGRLSLKNHLPHILSVKAVHRAMLEHNLLPTGWYSYGTQFNLYTGLIQMQVPTHFRDCPSHPAAKTMMVGEEASKPNCMYGLLTAS